MERRATAQPGEYPITFDEGLAPLYTPQMLDVLSAKHVPATFFVVGVNAEQLPSLIKREYAEGHEIGNHTYSHPNIAATSEEPTNPQLMSTHPIIHNPLCLSTTP